MVARQHAPWIPLADSRDGDQDPAPSQDRPDWEELWRALQAPLPVAERARLVSGFGVDLGSGRRPRPFEVSLARAGLGLDAALEVPRSAWAPLTPLAAGVVVRLLPPGPDRAWALAAALGPGGEADLLPARLQEGYEAFVAAERAFDGPLATALARAMHRQARATWSAFCLEGILRRTGDLAGAEAVLSELERAANRQERADRAGRRAIVARGEGRLALACDHLGAVLAAGGADGAQMMGLQALRSGSRPEAAAHFAALLAGESLAAGSGAPAPWAQRGFGVTLLPGRD
ncbi:MAG: hypothetical protein ISQ08_01705 [Planctomycetes bacterium]|nr:hypothetical protein [Planctomycetota bacterium]